MKCPRCGSEDVIKEYDEFFEKFTCPKCGWEDVRGEKRA
jgi:predicted RNA-binding Zn-ribbon protein involved in translation (DUF1610 family)